MCSLVMLITSSISIINDRKNLHNDFVNKRNRFQPFDKNLTQRIYTLGLHGSSKTMKVLKFSIFEAKYSKVHKFSENLP